MNKVVITGLGVVSAIGKDKQTFWESLLNNRSGVDTLTKFNPEKYKTQVAAEIKDFSLAESLPDHDLKNLPLQAQYATVALEEALSDAKLNISDEVNPQRLGVIIGSGLGGTYYGEEVLHKFYRGQLEGEPKRVHPMLIPHVDPNTLASRIAMHINALGPQMCISSACSSSGHAIGLAKMMIENGLADVVVTGGAEAPITPLTFAGFDQIRAMSTKNDTPAQACTPFAAERQGFVMGEGSGILILESEAHAKARNAPIYAELCGYGANGGAHHMVNSEPSGTDAAAVINMALDNAGLSAEEVDLINPHGTATKQNDQAEAQALRKVFGDRLLELPVSPTKHLTGHTLGAAASMEAIHCLLSIQHNTVSGVHYNPDSEADMPPLNITNKTRRAEVKVAISNSFGFGNNNSCLVFRKTS